MADVASSSSPSGGAGAGLFPETPISAATVPMDSLTIVMLCTPMEELDAAEARHLWRLLTNISVCDLANAAVELEWHNVKPRLIVGDDRIRAGDILHYAYRNLYARPLSVKYLDASVRDLFDQLQRRGNADFFSHLTAPAISAPTVELIEELRPPTSYTRPAAQSLSAPVVEYVKELRPPQTLYEEEDDSDDESSSESSYESSDDEDYPSSSKPRTTDEMIAATFDTIKRITVMPSIVRKAKVVSVAGGNQDALDSMVKSLMASFYVLGRTTRYIQYSRGSQRSRRQSYSTPFAKFNIRDQNFNGSMPVPKDVEKCWPKAEFKNKVSLCVIIDRSDRTVDSISYLVKHFRSIGAVVIIANLVTSASPYLMTHSKVADIACIMGKTAYYDDGMDKKDRTGFAKARQQVKNEGDGIFFNPSRSKSANRVVLVSKQHCY
jgi:hypothetical protein